MSITQPAETRQNGRYRTLTPDQVQQFGFTPIPTYPRSRAIAPCWKPGYGIDVAAGLQADGTYLHLLDLDSHSPGQDASAQLARIQKRVGPDLAARLAIRISRSGHGYHIIYRTATPHSEHAFIKVFDPLRPEHHIGELIGPGQRVTLTGEWLQHGPDAIPLLTPSELSLLRAAIHTPALYAPQNTPGSPQSEPGSHNPRKDRMAEGLDLIAGWEQVTDVQQRLEALAQRKKQVEQHLREMRRTPRNRSDAYSQLVQCLMYHARDLGRDLAERCRVVAALAIHVGAAGKERERTYKIITDTATLIARILHGDAFLNTPDLHFSIPRWVNDQDIPARPATPTRAQSAARTPSRLADDRQKNIKKLLRYVRKLPSDECGKRYTSADDLAEHLRVSRRTISSYLSELRERGALLSGQDGGNGPLYIIISEPPKATQDRCRHARLPKDEPHATTQTQTDRAEERAPESPALMPQNPSEQRVCTEVLGAPKPCAPAVGEAAPVVGDDQPEPAGASFEPLAGDQGASYHPIGDLAVAIGADYPLADDQADAAGASFVPLAGDQADDQAEVAGASFEPLAGDQPASYEPIDDQAEPAGAVSTDDQADEAGASYDPGLDQIAAAADARPGRRRKRKDPIRKKLDEARQRVEGWRRMDLPRLEIERSKLAGAAQDCERSAKQRDLFSAMVSEIDHEIGRKRSAGIQAMYQAANDTTRLPANEQAAPVARVEGRVWRSPVVHCDWEPEPFVPREVTPREHPIATLGTDPEAMRAAHEYCAAVLARAGES